MSNLIVFDLDGVITDESAYWDAAGLTVHELLYSQRYWHLNSTVSRSEDLYCPAASATESRNISRVILPESEILALKARAINSDWDICYAAVCLHLIDLLAHLPFLASLLPLQPWDADWLTAFRRHMIDTKEQKEHPASPAVPPHSRDFVNIQLLDAPLFHGAVGLELINHFDTYASQRLGHPIEHVFSRRSPFWAFCRDIFQEWYLGDVLYIQTYGQSPTQGGKPGCIHFERPLLPLEQVRSTLEELHHQGYTLGFATGRPRQEALLPLQMYGLLEYFDEQRLATYDDVERSEAQLQVSGDKRYLSKPHPYQFLYAAGHDPIEARSKTLHHENFVVVGDSTSDILAGRAAGALTVAVLTGARSPEARNRLAQSNPDFTIEDMTRLPALLAGINAHQ